MRRCAYRRLLMGIVAVWAVEAGAMDQPRRVFVGIAPLKYFAQRILGDRIAVSALVPADRSPETYEPTPRQMTDLAAAELYIGVGMPFERVWLGRIATQHPGLRIEDCSAREQRDDAMPVTVDPHIWTSPRQARMLAACMAQALVALEPRQADNMSANLDVLYEDLDALDADMQRMFASSGVRSFLILHPALGYLAHDYGLQQVAIERQGKEPSARQLAELIDWARRSGISALLVQRQFARAPAESIAAEIGARIIEIDPLAENYFDSLRLIAAAIASEAQ